MNQSQAEIISAYAGFIDEKLDDGWRAYLLTFTFNQLPGKPVTAREIMRQELERMYATMVTRLVRKPRSPAAQELLPKWICFPDRPVPKGVRESLERIAPNDGVHFHAIAVFHPKSRIRAIRKHVRQYQGLYLGNGGKVARVDAARIRKTPERATDYALKSYSRGRYDADDFVVFPRSVTELRSVRALMSNAGL
jgi:hypothetical protein